MKLENIEIREAKKEDLNSVLNLWKKLADYHHRIDKKRYLTGKEREKHFEKRLKDFFAKKRKNRKIFTAVKDGRIIGYIMVSIHKSPSYLRERKIGEVDSFFIDEKFRKKGIGQMLFEEALKWFKKRRIKLVEVLVDSRNEVGISAYQKYGFSEVAKRMALKLLV